MKREITPELVRVTKSWLRDDGLSFFKNVKEKHGEINSVWLEGSIPHPVHFREGMQVRNFMRSTNLCEGWDAHDYDDNWVELIERCIE